MLWAEGVPRPTRANRAALHHLSSSGQTQHRFQYVGGSYNADQLVLSDRREPANLVGEEHSQRFGDAVVGSDADRMFSHNSADLSGFGLASTYICHGQ